METATRPGRHTRPAAKRSLKSALWAPVALGEFLLAGYATTSTTALVLVVGGSIVTALCFLFPIAMMIMVFPATYRVLARRSRGCGNEHHRPAGDVGHRRRASVRPVAEPGVQAGPARHHHVRRHARCHRHRAPHQGDHRRDRAPLHPGDGRHLHRRRARPPGPRPLGDAGDARLVSGGRRRRDLLDPLAPSPARQPVRHAEELCGRAPHDELRDALHGRSGAWPCPAGSPSLWAVSCSPVWRPHNHAAPASH